MQTPATNTTRIVYRDAGPDGIDAIRPLWERLRDHHAAFPEWQFAGDVRAVQFEGRKAELLGKSAGGKLRLELAAASEASEPVAYCVSSISEAGRGEIDSMFVDERWRGHGVGGELVRRALAWMDAEGATSKVVAVASANADAMAFYARLGFVPRTVQMEHRVERR